MFDMYKLNSFFKTESNSGALAGLELIYVDQIGLEHMEIYLPLLSECGD